MLIDCRFGASGRRAAPSRTRQPITIRSGRATRSVRTMTRRHGSDALGEAGAAPTPALPSSGLASAALALLILARQAAARARRQAAAGAPAHQSHHDDLPMHNHGPSPRRRGPRDGRSAAACYRRRGGLGRIGRRPASGAAGVPDAHCAATRCKHGPRKRPSGRRIAGARRRRGIAH